MSGGGIIPAAAAAIDATFCMCVAVITPGKAEDIPGTGMGTGTGTGPAAATRDTCSCHARAAATGSSGGILGAMVRGPGAPEAVFPGAHELVFLVAPGLGKAAAFPPPERR